MEVLNCVTTEGLNGETNSSKPQNGNTPNSNTMIGLWPVARADSLKSHRAVIGTESPKRGENHQKGGRVWLEVSSRTAVNRLSGRLSIQSLRSSVERGTPDLRTRLTVVKSPGAASLCFHVHRNLMKSRSSVRSRLLLDRSLNYTGSVGRPDDQLISPRSRHLPVKAPEDPTRS